jgi:hypothetical protein
LNDIAPWHAGPEWSGWAEPEAAGHALTAMNALDDIAADTRNPDTVAGLIAIREVIRRARETMTHRAATRQGVTASPPLEALDHITGIVTSADGAVSRMNRIRAVLRTTGRNPGEDS